MTVIGEFKIFREEAPQPWGVFHDDHTGHTLIAIFKTRREARECMARLNAALKGSVK